MLSADEAFAGPAALAERVRTGELKPRELVELCLSRIESLDGRLNAFRVTMAERALAEADALKATDGPLAGVPVAIKDDLAVAGQAMTKGSRSYGPPEPVDSEAVRRLRVAGAVPIGITNVPELMIWPWTATEANGVTRNPWDPSRSPGGSSGGSAAAVASGMVPAATGSDGGGSIRIPAACCGLVGMKSTRGRVPAGKPEAPWLDLSVFGALARTVKDSALMLDVMAGTGSLFSSAAASVPRRLKVAVSRKIPAGLVARVSADQRAAWEQTGTLLAELGHEVVERHPAYGLAILEFTQAWTRGIYEDSLTIPDRSRLEPLSRRMAGLGRLIVPDRRRARLLSRRAAPTARILALWDEVDVLLTPALSRTALPADGGFGKPAPLAFNLGASFTPFTPVINLTGQPAIAVPAGVGSDGLPLSVQLVGRPGGEETLFALAAQIEAARPLADRRPPIS
jgi:amidase